MQPYAVVQAALATNRSFNGNGLVVFRPQDERGELKAVLVGDGADAPAGEIVVGGWTDTRPHTAAKFLLARINPDGSFDSTFGNNGKVTTAFHHDETSVIQGLLFFSGRIIAAGFSTFSGETHAAMARYLE